MEFGARRPSALIDSALIGAVLGTLMLAVVGCSTISGDRGGPKMGLIAASPDGNGFTELDSGRPFVPFGTNYYDPNTGWPPKVWQRFDPNRVSEHFAVMKNLGVNCARVFLAASAFQPDVNSVDEESLRKLDTLIRIARRSGIRLILTGPDHWEGRPDYWEPDRFAGEPALRALETFWETVAARYRGEPAIFAWDLLNEPQMPWFVETWEPKWNAWLEAKYGDRAGLKAAWTDELKEAESWGRIAVADDEADAGNPRLLDWQRFREHLADEWVRRQVEIIRRVDPTHPITVGYIQWSYPIIRPGDPSLYAAFNPHRQAQWLDFISVHFYPLMGRPFGSKRNWDNNLAYLQSILAYCHAGKPVVLSEFGWYGGGQPPGRPFLSEDEQSRWLTAEVEASRRMADGWLSWPFADTPDSDDMSRFGGLMKWDMVHKLWAWRFRTYAHNLDVLSQPTPELPTFDFAPSLTTPIESLMAMHEKYAEQVQAAIEQAGPLPDLKPVPLPNAEPAAD